jgi:hypothetical protein
MPGIALEKLVGFCGLIGLQHTIPPLISVPPE